ncbi:MAG: caspase family protein [Prevotella sp.]|nr:caspase family protein [Prevotella sp.]
MKKIYLFLILFHVSAVLYAFDFTYQGVTFKCKTSGQFVTITGFDVRARKVVVPATVTHHGVTYQVKSISTFLNGVNYMAETLVLEEGIEDIDKFSFNEFRRLMDVTLPSSLSHIGRNAFRDNKGMTYHLASNISEESLRRGKEFYPTPDTSRKSSNQHLLAANTTTLQPVAASQPAPQPEQKPVEKSVPAPKQVKKTVDVDMDIPVTSLKNTDTYCVIIANEKYEDVPQVEYATRDGEIFREYCLKTLGVPEKQVKTFIDASYTDIKRALNWIETIAEVTEGNSKFIFYYAGHGLPSDKDQTAYLVPVDGFPKDITTCYKMSELYRRLGNIKSQNVTVFLDACFSGIERGKSQALVAARGVAIKPKKDELMGNVVVFTATSDDETALAYHEKQHGMFTYYLLNKLKESKGKAKFGDLYNSVSLQVKKCSVLENDKLQSPSVNVSASMRDKWQDLQF